MVSKIFITIAFGILAIPFAQSESTMKFSGWGWVTMGRVENSIEEEIEYDINFEKEWLFDFMAGLKATKSLSEYERIRLHFGMSTAYVVLDYQKENAEFLRRKFVPFIMDATLEHTFPLGNRSTIYTEFGYFPVKYNPEVRNLGEYLFRSGTYPGYTYGGFEVADKEKLAGLHLGYKMDLYTDQWLKADIYLSSGVNDFPVHDFSLSYMFTAKPIPFIELGFGMMHAHFVTLDNRKTTPATDTVVFRRGTVLWNNVGWVDPATGDTIEYTFKGTKGVARFTLDPKGGNNFGIFGKEDLKIYSEVALLGFKNYPGWYEKRKERTPIMFGFNFPTFNILDVLAFELEWHDSPYMNTAENVWRHRSPVPYVGSQISFLDGDWEKQADDDWKWSVYASKKILKRFRISAQVASDHIKRTKYMPPPPSFSKYTEIVPRTKDWYWMTRLMFYF